MAGLQELAAQAMSNADGDEDMEKQIQEALACPCVADLREGPCGSTFVEAFSCYIRSEHEEKGMDCLEEFKFFQECLKKNPDHVEKIMQDAEDVVQEGESNNKGLNAKSEATATAEAVPEKQVTTS